MTLVELLNHLRQPKPILEFAEVIACIKQHYHYQPTAFQNGPVENLAGENEGSCIIFAFAKRHRLSNEQALLCFGEHYQEVLKDPEGKGHKNIRQFMRTGLAGIHFERQALE